MSALEFFGPLLGGVAVGLVCFALLALLAAWWLNRWHTAQVNRHPLPGDVFTDEAPEVGECFYCKRLLPAHRLRDGECRECGMWTA